MAGRVTQEDHGVLRGVSTGLNYSQRRLAAVDVLKIVPGDAEFIAGQRELRFELLLQVVHEGLHERVGGKAPEVGGVPRLSKRVYVLRGDKGFGGPGKEAFAGGRGRLQEDWR